MGMEDETKGKHGYRRVGTGASQHRGWGREEREGDEDSRKGGKKEEEEIHVNWGKKRISHVVHISDFVMVY